MLLLLVECCRDGENRLMEIILLFLKAAFILRAGVWKRLGRPPPGTRGVRWQHLVHAQQNSSTLAMLRLSTLFWAKPWFFRSVSPSKVIMFWVHELGQFCCQLLLHLVRGLAAGRDCRWDRGWSCFTVAGRACCAGPPLLCLAWVGIPMWTSGVGSAWGCTWGEEAWDRAVMQGALPWPCCLVAALRCAQGLISNTFWL